MSPPRLVVLDPGHQAQADLDPEPVRPGSSVTKPRCAAGTRGPDTAIFEHQVALTLAAQAATELSRRGVRTRLTRDTAEVQLSNAERALLANRLDAALCVRIHCNGVRPALRRLRRLRRGTLTLVPARDAIAEPLYKASRCAGIVLHAAVLGATRFPDLGLRERDDLTGFNWSEVPVVLLELGYLTHPAEERAMVNAECQRRIAEAIAAGTVEALDRCLATGSAGR